jgi:hypothetical protein
MFYKIVTFARQPPCVTPVLRVVCSSKFECGGYVIVKKILAGVAAVVTTVVLTACSGGASGGNVSLAAANGSPTTSASPSPSQTTSASPSTSAPAPSTSTSKPTPTKTPTKAPQPKSAAPVADPGVPCAATVSACVDLSAHKAWLLEGGKVVYGPVPMLPGRPSNPTPTGTFHVYSKEKMHLSKEFDNAPMPNSVFFYPGDAFHTGSLTVYSHGCIHLSSAASLKFFNTLSIGDVVQVVP